MEILPTAFFGLINIANYGPSVLSLANFGVVVKLTGCGILSRYLTWLSRGMPLFSPNSPE